MRLMLSLRTSIMTCDFHQSNHVSSIKTVIWLAAGECLKEEEGKNDQDGRAVKAVYTLLRFVFPAISDALKPMKESIMSVSSLVGAIDDIARCSSVLAEGIEGGLSLRFSAAFRVIFIRIYALCVLKYDGFLALRLISPIWNYFFCPSLWNLSWDKLILN